MILDRFENVEEYFDRIPNLEKACAFIREHKELAPGRYPFPGGYLIYQDQVTSPLEDGTYESHRRYVDVQVLLEGEGWHTMWNRVEQMKEAVPYDSERDMIRWVGEGALIGLQPGMFVCFYPADAHKPDKCLPEAGPAAYRKYVIKLELEEKM